MLRLAENSMDVLSILFFRLKNNVFLSYAYVFQKHIGNQDTYYYYRETVNHKLVFKNTLCTKATNLIDFIKDTRYLIINQPRVELDVSKNKVFPCTRINSKPPIRHNQMQVMLYELLFELTQTFMNKFYSYGTSNGLLKKKVKF